MKNFLLLSLLVIPSLFAGDVPPSLKLWRDSQRINKKACVFASSIGRARLYHNGSNFLISRTRDKTSQEEITEIGSESIDPSLRRATNPLVLQALLKAGKIEASQASDGSVILRHRVNGLGGGPLAAQTFYWLTKSLCYGTAAAAAGTAVVMTGGTAGALTGALVAGGTASVSTGAGIVAGAIAGGGLAGEAVIATGAVVTGAGGIGGAVAVVEGAAAAAYVLGMACPWLP